MRKTKCLPRWLVVLPLAAVLSWPLLARPLSPAQQPLPEVAFLPPDLFAVLHLQVGRLWDSIPARQARQSLAPTVLNFANRLVNRMLGVPLDQVDRLTICLCQPDQSDLVMLVATKGPVDRAKLASRMTSRLKLTAEQNYGGFKLHLSAPGKSWPESQSSTQALVMLGPQLYAVGRHDLLLGFLDQVRRTVERGPLSQEYAQLHEPYHLTLLARPKAATATANSSEVFVAVPPAPVNQGTPSPPFGPLFQPGQLLALLAPFDGLERVQVRLRLEPQCDVQAQMDFSSESLARRGYRRLNAAVADFQGWLERLETWLRAPGRVDGVQLPAFPDVATLTGVFREGLDQVSLDQQRNQVNLAGSFKLPAWQLHAAFLDLTGRIPLAFAAEERKLRLNSLALALHNYHRDYEQFPPPGSMDATEKPLLSWRVLLLPYLDQKPLFDRFKKNEPWDSPHNQALLPLMPDCYAILGAEVPEPAGHTYYQVFVGRKSLPLKEQPLFCWGRSMSLGQLRDHDGGSHTVAIVEAGTAVPWTQPVDIEYDPTQPLPLLGGAFPGEPTFLVATADGTVRAVHRQLDDDTRYRLLLRQLITFADGQSVDDAELFK